MAYPVVYTFSGARGSTYPSNAELQPPPLLPITQTPSFMQLQRPPTLMPIYPTYPQRSYTPYQTHSTTIAMLLDQSQAELGQTQTLLSETQTRLIDALSINAQLAQQAHGIAATFFSPFINPQHNPSQISTSAMQPARPPATALQPTPKSSLRLFKSNLPAFLSIAASRQSLYECTLIKLRTDVPDILAKDLLENLEVILKLIGDKEDLEEISNILHNTMMNSDTQLTKEQSTALANSLRSITLESMTSTEINLVIEAINEKLTLKASQLAHPSAATPQVSYKSPMSSFKRKLPKFLLDAASDISLYEVNCKLIRLSKRSAQLLAKSLFDNLEVIPKLLDDKKDLKEPANILYRTLMNRTSQLTKDQSLALANSLHSIIKRDIPPIIAKAIPTKGLAPVTSSTRETSHA